MKLPAPRAAEHVVGGGVVYSDAADALDGFVSRFDVPFTETQAGKGALPWDHPLNMGAVGSTGTSGGNAVARDADLVIAIGTFATWMLIDGEVQTAMQAAVAVLVLAGLVVVLRDPAAVRGRVEALFRRPDRPPRTAGDEQYYRPYWTR